MVSRSERMGPTNPLCPLEGSKGSSRTGGFLVLPSSLSLAHPSSPVSHVTCRIEEGDAIIWGQWEAY
jgi:hypothetical protein